MSYLGEDVKKLGFGLMRLPKTGDAIDIEQTKKMVDMFLEAGFTYFDTAWAYGGSEDAIRQALVERYPRESYTLATKLAAWIRCETKEQAEEQFYTSLKNTGAGYFDFYLLHNLGSERTHFFDDFDIWNFVQEKKKEGLIRHVGFSAHTTAENLDQILTAHPEVEFVQLQINYVDWDDANVQSGACYEVCRKHNKPVVIMEPVKGGMLANPHDSVKEIFKAAEPDMSCASWAVRFAASLPGVITVLSGMSNIEQMQDNLSYMKDFTSLTAKQQEVVKKAQEAFKKVPVIPCTGCDYCAKVCPNDIAISSAFKTMNSLLLYGPNEGSVARYKAAAEKNGKRLPSECLQCGACEDACPQSIGIREALIKAAEMLG